MKDVCYNCQKRYLGCHSKCKDYKDAKQEHDIEKANIRKEREKVWNLNNYVKESIEKGKRRHAIR